MNHEVFCYRNIEKACFSPCAELTVISGENGQGKTNLLESIWLLSGAKSFRGAKDEELIKKGESFSKIESMVYTASREKKVQLLIGNEQAAKKGRFASVNEVDYGRASSLAGEFFCAVFAPIHLSLIKGPAEGRRRFLDAALCQIYPNYISVLRRYNRILMQKNALLKEIKIKRQSYELIDALDADFAKCGTEIAQRRQQYISNILPYAAQQYEKIARGKEKLYFKYQTESESEQLFAELLSKSRQEDIRTGFCTKGPHRDDFFIFINGEDARTYASQGQQRSAALCIKLAEAEVILQIAGEAPVILLDDVLSELDSYRQKYLLNQTAGRQVIVTSCEADMFQKTSGAIYKMENGHLAKER